MAGSHGTAWRRGEDDEHPASFNVLHQQRGLSRGRDAPRGSDSTKTRTETLGAYRVADAIDRAVGRARAAILACGRTFLGRIAVLGQSFQRKAESFEPRRGPVPKVRARNRALLKAMLARYAAFWEVYREALAAWRDGNRGIVFPFGTWAMRLHHSALVASG